MPIVSELEELKETFICDVEDNLATMEALVLMLENSPAEEAMLNALSRTAHTLKGAASCMNYEPFLAVAHAAEDVLEGVRKHTIVFDERIAATLLRTVDVLRRMVPEAVAGAAELSAEATALIATFEEISARGESEAGASFARARRLDAAAPTSKTVRVSREKLEELSAMLQQLEALQHHLHSLVGAPTRDIEECQLATDELIRGLRDMVATTRFVPVGSHFRQFVRVARDTGLQMNKDVRLVIEDEHAEVDAAILDGLRDALGHMIRNAVDHGIENVEGRARVGKPLAGTLTLRTSLSEERVTISLADDGRGLDWAGIRRRGIEDGRLQEGESVTDDQLAALIFEPGFTTAAAVTTISGRGVGMDVVKASVEALGGRIEIRSAPGAGTTIQLIVPNRR